MRTSHLRLRLPLTHPRCRAVVEAELCRFVDWPWLLLAPALFLWTRCIRSASSPLPTFHDQREATFARSTSCPIETLDYHSLPLVSSLDIRRALATPRRRSGIRPPTSWSPRIASPVEAGEKGLLRRHTHTFSTPSVSYFTRVSFASPTPPRVCFRRSSHQRLVWNDNGRGKETPSRPSSATSIVL